MRAVLVVVATGATGLLAGTYLAFAVAVMPALRQLDDTTFVEVMRRINVVIVNPVFLALFLGSPLLVALAAALGPQRGWWLVAAGAAVATLLLTVAVNVPLNDRLAATTDPAAARRAFESTWNLAHLVRTGLACGALAACLRAATLT